MTEILLLAYGVKLLLVTMVVTILLLQLAQELKFQQDVLGQSLVDVIAGFLGLLIDGVAFVKPNRVRAG